LLIALLAGLWCLGLSVTSALAHAPIQGIGAFYNGLLHPILVLEHLLLVVGVGLLLGQNGRQSGRYGWAAFVVALCLGLVAGYLSSAAIPQTIIPVLALIAGGCLALERPLGAWLVATIMGTAGLAIGLDSRPDGIPYRQIWLAQTGTAIGGVLLLSYIGGMAASMTRPWHRIAIRVAGSWVVAVATVALSLTIFGRIDPIQ
jgi:urease accessory protein